MGSCSCVCVHACTCAFMCVCMCMHAPTRPSPSWPLVFPSKLSLLTGRGERMASPLLRGLMVPEAPVRVTPAEPESSVTSRNTAATAAMQQLARKSRHSQEHHCGAGCCAQCMMQTVHCITSWTTSMSCTTLSRSTRMKAGLPVIPLTDSMLLQQTGNGTLHWHKNSGTGAHLGHLRSELVELSDSRLPASQVKMALQPVGHGCFLVVFVIVGRLIQPHRGLCMPPLVLYTFYKSVVSNK